MKGREAEVVVKWRLLVPSAATQDETSDVIAAAMSEAAQQMRKSGLGVVYFRVGTQTPCVYPPTGPPDRGGWGDAEGGPLTSDVRAALVCLILSGLLCVARILFAIALGSGFQKALFWMELAGLGSFLAILAGWTFLWRAATGEDFFSVLLEPPPMTDDAERKEKTRRAVEDLGAAIRAAGGDPERLAELAGWDRGSAATLLEHLRQEADLDDDAVARAATWAVLTEDWQGVHEVLSMVAGAAEAIEDLHRAGRVELCMVGRLAKVRLAPDEGSVAPTPLGGAGGADPGAVT